MFHYTKDNDNIVTITMDMQGRGANVFVKLKNKY